VSEGRLDRDEMVEILEEIIRDPETNSTARCTAIRTLLDIKPPEPSSDAWAALDEASPRRYKGSASR
jgi:hypothetical protein